MGPRNSVVNSLPGGVATAQRLACRSVTNAPRAGSQTDTGTKAAVLGRPEVLVWPLARQAHPLVDNAITIAARTESVVRLIRLQGSRWIDPTRVSCRQVGGEQRDG